MFLNVKTKRTSYSKLTSNNNIIQFKKPVHDPPLTNNAGKYIKKVHRNKRLKKKNPAIKKYLFLLQFSIKIKYIQVKASETWVS